MAPRSSRDPSQWRDQRRRSHRYTDSNTDLIPPPGPPDHTSPSPSPPKSRPKKAHRQRQNHSESETSKATSNPLSAGSLAQLDAVNDNLGWSDYDGLRPRDGGPGAAEEAEEEEEQDLIRKRQRQRQRRDTRERRPVSEEEDDIRRRQRHERRERRRRESHAALEPSGKGGDPIETRHHSNKSARRALGGYAVQEEPRRRIVSGTHLEQGPKRYSEKHVYEHEQRPKQRGGAASTESDEEYEARRKKRKRWMCRSSNGVVGTALVIRTDPTQRDRQWCHHHTCRRRHSPWSCPVQSKVIYIVNSRRRQLDYGLLDAQKLKLEGHVRS